MCIRDRFSFGCSYETADIEFEYTLSQARQKGNNLAFHLIQSFEPGEVDCEKAHAIGKQLADAATKGQHEYVLTTHIDKGHIHNHIIFCAVNFVDYHKYMNTADAIAVLFELAKDINTNLSTATNPHKEIAEEAFEIFTRTGGANLTITNPWYNPVEYSGSISQLY